MPGVPRGDRCTQRPPWQTEEVLLGHLPLAGWSPCRAGAHYGVGGLDQRAVRRLAPDAGVVGIPRVAV